MQPPSSSQHSTTTMGSDDNTSINNNNTNIAGSSRSSSTMVSDTVAYIRNEFRQSFVRSAIARASGGLVGGDGGETLDDSSNASSSSGSGGPMTPHERAEQARREENVTRFMNEDSAAASRNVPWQDLGFWGRLSKTVQQQADTDFREQEPGMEKLMAKYSKEFEAADTKMRKRHEERSVNDRINMKFNYDYDADREFHAFMDRRSQAKEHLKVHWIDDWLDDGKEIIRIAWRFYGTAGLSYAAIRTGYVWRTMDKTYARLNGITLFQVASYEVSLGILKGFFCGMCYATGNMVGDSVSRVAMNLYKNEIHYQPREWWTVGSSLGLGGALQMGGLWALVTAFHPEWRSGISPAARRLFWVSHGIAHLGFTSYCSLYVYKRWIDSFPEGTLRYDDSGTPWNQRTVSSLGHFKGRLA